MRLSKLTEERLVSLFPSFSYGARKMVGLTSNTDVNPRDYRAWYGLGQTYELLDMPQYAIQYYNKATALRYEVLSVLSSRENATYSNMSVLG